MASAVAPAPAANNCNFPHDSFRPISIRGSVPAMRRSMFFRCLTIIKTDESSVPRCYGQFGGRVGRGA